ncbi:MAG: tRNA pseudouridine(38-40) synthase TruA [Oscillochloris sp.]|nr:tRNA pseudouridine(38-40) synthase TruA [Oscillochloris sp.]
MRNIALRLAYDGTDFVGSQWQNQGRSVQGALEEAWQGLTQEQRRLLLAGRTDAGVHAQGQVANVRTETQHDLTTIRRGLNALLPEDVAIQAVCEVDREFHSRYSAIRREYRYLIDNAPAPLPFLRNLALRVEQPLDTGAMAAALPLLEGTHDFAAFTVNSPEQKSTVRTVYQARLGSIELFGRQLIAIDLAANAFLQHMVRVIIGTVLKVGRGKMKPDQMSDVLASCDRRAAGPTSAAHGLNLIEVIYPDGVVEWEDGRQRPRIREKR